MTRYDKFSICSVSLHRAWLLIIVDCHATILRDDTDVFVETYAQGSTRDTAKLVLRGMAW